MFQWRASTSFARLCVLLLVAMAVTTGHADTPLRVEQAWIRLLPGDLPLAGYFQLVNESGAPANLVSAESPGFGGIMLHRSIVVGGSSRMEHVDSVQVPDGGSVRFEPGGYHLMLMKRQDALRVGDHVPITLRFADGRQLTAEFEVRAANAN